MNELSYSALMPPMCLLIATPAGLVIALRWRRTGIAIALISSLLLYACCTRLVSERLLALVENEVPPASATGTADAQAIVVLSGDIYHGRAGSGVPDDVGPLTLERLRLAASLYRARPLPILVTGGVQENNAESSASLMAQALERDFGIKATWIEGRAANTYENGAYSAAILKANNVTRVIVVTQAWHMPRALWSLAHAGVIAIPAPAERSYPGRAIAWSALLPDYASFARSFYALHEFLGLAYYRLRYGPVKPAD